MDSSDGINMGRSTERMQEISASTRFFNRHKRSIMSVYMVIVDIIALLLAGWLAVGIRSLFRPALTDPAQYYALLPLLLIFIPANLIARLYPGNGISPHEELRSTTYAISVVMILLAACCILVWFLEGHAGLTIFEDGSFILGTWAGCLPGGICN